MLRRAQSHLRLSRRNRRLVRATIASAAGLAKGPALAEMLEGRMLLSGGTFTVSNLSDSGAGSLRQAITDADAAGGTDIINFTGVSGTIDLDSELPAISSNITADGPGASQLTVNGGGFGSVFVVNNGNAVEIENLTITSGAGRLGGGIENDGTLVVADCIVSGNTATLGGGINSYGTLTVTNSTISGNKALKSGGGIYCLGFTDIITDSISGNMASSRGGGICGYYLIGPFAGSLSVANCTITGNSAALDGGGIFSPPPRVAKNFTVTVTDSTISGNSARDGGGGIYGGSTITDSTVSGNSAAYGGGIFDDGDTIANSTVSGNVAARGGGIFTIDAMPTVIDDTTVSGNSALTAGGGVYFQSYPNFSNDHTIVGTIIAADSGGDIDLPEGISVGGSNDLIGDGSDGGVLTNSLRGTAANPLSPMLTLLGNFGGPTQTMALMAGSPAIGAGANFPVLDANGNDITATDQRGVTRPATGIDIGAYQSGVLVVNTLTDPATSTTPILSLREAIADANTIGGNNTIDFASGLTGTIELGSVLPAINSNITIDGPGASLLTVNGGRHGSVFTIDAGVASEIEGLTITGGKAFAGGGIHSLGALTVADSFISGNATTDYGGGIYNAGNGTLTVIDSTVAGNSSNFLGGGVFNIAGVFGANTVGIYDSIISGNSAGENGGGIDTEYGFGSASVTSCTISGNTAMFGGGISGPSTVISSTITGNRAHESGGGLASFATIINSTICGNTATATGGAIDGQVNITDSTIVGNSVGKKSYSALSLIDGTSVMNGTVVADNSGSEIAIVIDASLEGSNDLIGDGSDGGVLTNSLRGTAANPLNPMLAPLGNYGGLTQTMAELPGSPAIGAGTYFSNVATDQRGFARPTTSGIDIGADQGALFAGDTNFDGTVNLTDLLILLNHYAQSANDNSIVAPAANVGVYKAANTPFASEPLGKSSSGSLFAPISGVNDPDGDILNGNSLDAPL